MKLLYVITMALLPLTCHATNMITEITNKYAFETLIKTSQQPVVAQFHSGCSVCNTTRKHLNSITSLYPNVTFVEIDINKIQNIAELYNIVALPSVLVFEPHATTPTHIITGPNKNELIVKINNVVSKGINTK